MGYFTIDTQPRNLPVKLTGYTAIERNNIVANYVRRGYKVTGRGKYNSNNNSANRTVYWATVVKDDEES